MKIRLYKYIHMKLAVHLSVVISIKNTDIAQNFKLYQSKFKFKYLTSSTDKSENCFLHLNTKITLSHRHFDPTVSKSYG